MRGTDHSQSFLFSYRTLEQRVPAGHPLRALKPLVEEALRGLRPHWRRLYSKYGRPSIPPERLLRALLLQVLFSVRSERRLMEELDYNLLFRWFVGLEMDEAVWDVTVFTKNRDRLLEGEIAQGFFAQVLKQAECRKLISHEHFTVDGTLVEAWAGEKSYRPKQDPPPRGSGRGGALLLRDTHASTTDPQARLFRKNANGPLKLSYQAHAVSENRNGLIVASAVSLASTKAERTVGLALLRKLKKKQRFAVKTVGADKAYNEQDFVEGLRELRIEAHVPFYRANRRDWAAPAMRESKGYAISQNKRKWVERCFGWLKQIGGQRKTKFRGTQRVGWMFTFAAAVYNLVRIRNLAALTA